MTITLTIAITKLFASESAELETQYNICMCLGSTVVSVMDSHSCDRGSNPTKANTSMSSKHYPNNAQFISDEHY